MSTFDFSGCSAWVQKLMLNSLANTAHWGLGQTRGNIADTLGELRELMEAYQGAEVQDSQIAQKAEWVERMEGQLAEFEALKSQAVAAYEGATGSKWQPRPTNGKGQPGKTATAARSKAASILAKYQSS